MILTPPTCFWGLFKTLYILAVLENLGFGEPLVLFPDFLLRRILNVLNSKVVKNCNLYYAMAKPFDSTFR